MSDPSSQQPVVDPSADEAAASSREPPAASIPAPGWSDLRSRLLAALDEDPVNAAALSRLLDHAEAGGDDPHQRAVAVLAGMRPGQAEARRLLEAALAGGAGGRPLRVALMEAVVAENRRRPEPWLLEMRAGPAPVSGRIADPAHGATEAGALRGAIQDELRRARRFRQECALLDLAPEDGHGLARRVGPAAADRALCSLALLVNNEIRDVDWTARTPEGELVVFLAGTGRLGAVLAARRLVAKAGGLAWPGAEAGPRVSIGVAAFPEDARFGKDLLAAARRALYRARGRGGGVCDRAEVPGRSYVHVSPGSVRTVVRALPAEEAPVPDAGDGILFVSSVPYGVGEGLELDCIEVAGRGRARVRGRVVRLEERPGGDGYEIGISCDLEPDAAGLLGGPTGPGTDARDR